MYNDGDPGGSPQQIGLVGLGNMGSAIAERLVLSTRPLVFDIDGQRVADVSERLAVTVAQSLDDFRTADLVLLCLPHPSASLSVVRTLAGILKPGSVLIETSTVAPEQIHECASIARAHGIGLIDAALAAGVGQMRAGTAAALVGGSPEDVATARPALHAFTRNVYVIGDLGAGAALKVINNAVAHAVMVVLVEAAALATASGIDRSHLIRLMTGTDAGLTRPLEHRLMERIATGNYDGGMPTEAALKDSMLALELARSRKVPVFAIGGSHAVYEMATAEGFARLDYAAIAKLWERWLGVSLSVDQPGSGE